MKKLHFKIAISAPLSVVYDKMLGLSSKKNYEQWTALFNPTSTYEGNWKKGSIPELWDGKTAERIIDVIISL